MKFLITTLREPTLAVWQSVLPEDDHVEYRLASARAVDADALCIAGIYAFERYGGAPRNDVAQILDNLRNDGLPSLIIVPPSLPMVREADGTVTVHPDFEEVSPAYHAMARTGEAILRWNERDSGKSIHTVVVDLPLLGMDAPDDRKTPCSARRAIHDTFTDS
ncbi:hypothetical protein [Streptomyces rubiginosohelvolus]|uniref:hypothetical protein n=1 Tax=Streptomyces rubiginosohelvolus TaxID=67362 RepID=UPI0035E32E36